MSHQSAQASRGAAGTAASGACPAAATPAHHCCSSWGPGAVSQHLAEHRNVSFYTPAQQQQLC